jgi:Meckel syndrome type 1 protein
MMSTVDLADETPGGAGEPDAGLLGRLPRKRPQNASRRRASTHAAAETNGTAPSPAQERRAAGAAGKAAVKTKPAKRAPAPRKAKAGTKSAARPAAKAKPRAAAKAAAKAAPAVKAKPKVAAKPAARKAPTKRPRSTPKPGAEPPAVPPQGYESDGDRAQGIVRPPGGADFAATAFEAIGELTRFSLSAGERLVRDLLGRRS